MKETRAGSIALRLLLGTLALFLTFIILSYHPLDPHPLGKGSVSHEIQNIGGVFGAYLSGSIHTIAGYGGLILSFWMLWFCLPSERRSWMGHVAWVAFFLASLAMLGGLPRRTFTVEGGVGVLEARWGGWLGEYLWGLLGYWMGRVFRPLMLLLVQLLSLMVIAPTLSQRLAESFKNWMGNRAWPWFKPLPLLGMKKVLAWSQKPFLPGHSAPEITASDLLFEEETLMEAREAFLRAERMTSEHIKKKNATIPPLSENNLPVIHSVNLDEEEPALRLEALSEAQMAELTGKQSLQLSKPVLSKPLLAQARITSSGFGQVGLQEPLPLTEPTPIHPLPPIPEAHPQAILSQFVLRPDQLTPPAHSSSKGQERTTLSGRTTAPVFPTAPQITARPQPVLQPDLPNPLDREELPPRRFFQPPNQSHQIDREELESTRELILSKFLEFKIKGKITEIQPGPVVTVYEFLPDPGIPLSRVQGMDEDLALALSAEAVRIDRIPGRATVGIEVPNRKREIITFREIVDHSVFRDPRAGLLTLALGKDMSGHPMVMDLAKMPHLLIGGSTGSGKSVGLNAMICSILLRALPTEVKLILIDPKMVEMGIYADIPHLWAPVVTDMKEAGRLLKWVVAQMEERYQCLALISVRNLEQYNAKIMASGGSIDISKRTPNPRWLNRPDELKPMPTVVVVIDELADLMMVARSEVEESIARIAQKARAVGIHLVLATQRPSVDIVTGVIKANLPSRLSYQVNTKIDSRTILDSGGAEQLLGKGDALFLAPSSSRPKRVHAPFLSDQETLALVNWLKQRGQPDYNQSLIQAMAQEEEDGDVALTGRASSGDDVYDKAVAVVLRERKASTSLLQRKLNLGYGRAARIIDRMEQEGLIGPDRGAGKQREVLAPVGEESIN